MAIQPPPPEIWQPIEQQIPGIYQRFMQAVEAANAQADAAGLVYPTSWWRSASHNSSVGGAPRSQHLLGLAVDLVYRSSSAKAAARAQMEEWGLHTIDEGDHLHVQAMPAGSAEAAGLFRFV